MSNFTLRYKGLNCFGETGELSGSDEIYLFTIVTTIENGRAVVRTEKHPVDRPFYDEVDKGASFGGPIAPCYFGPPQDLSLTVIMMEQDQSDPNAFKAKIDAAVKAAAAASASQGVPIPEIVQQLGASAINELLGSGDDNLGEVTNTFTGAQVIEESRKVRGLDQNVSFTFFTEHTGEGSTFRAFFDFVEEGGLGAEASFRSINFPDLFIRHKNFLGELTAVVSDLDKHDATFTIVPGLADQRFISFASINFGGQFLRHQDFRIKLQQPPQPANLFFADATFIMEPGLADATGVSFRSFNFPDLFIRHRDFHLFIEPLNSPNLKVDATFRKEGPFVILPPH